MALIEIGGVQMPNPSTYKVTRSDLDSENTKRTEVGLLQRDRVRAGIYKIELGWEALTPDELKLIVDAIVPEEVNISFFDPTTFTINKSAQMYAGTITSELVRKMKETAPDESYWSLAFNLTEY